MSDDLDGDVELARRQARAVQRLRRQRALPLQVLRLSKLPERLPPVR